ncbi:hypothetical protein [Ferrovibrio terrae]|uniref:hypothetical protein n=1 Tax=Ferrovibrio terrae TaxID=2594003 RepID=UPI003137EA3D
MLTPDAIAQQFNTVLSESERVEMATALTPRLTQLFIKMLGQEYGPILQRLDTYQGRLKAEGRIGAPTPPAMPGLPGAPTMPRAQSPLSRVVA